MSVQFLQQKAWYPFTKPLGNSLLFTLLSFFLLCLDLYVEARHDDLGLIWHLSSQVKSLIHHIRHCHKLVLRSFHKWRQMMHQNEPEYLTLKTQQTQLCCSPAYSIFEINQHVKNTVKYDPIHCNQNCSAPLLFFLNIIVVKPLAKSTMIMMKNISIPTHSC